MNMLTVVHGLPYAAVFIWPPGHVLSPIRGNEHKVGVNFSGGNGLPLLPSIFNNAPLINDKQYVDDDFFATQQSLFPSNIFVINKSDLPPQKNPSKLLIKLHLQVFCFL